MKILLVSSLGENNIGGISSWTQNYFQYCKENAIDISLVNTVFEGKRNTDESVFKIKDEFSRLKRIIKSLKKAISNATYDVAHVNSSCSAMGLIRDYYVASTLKNNSIPVTIHFHCDIEFQINRWHGIKAKVGYYYLDKLMSLNPKVIVLGSSSKNYLHEKYGIEASVIPNFVDRSVVKDNKIINERLNSLVFVGHVIREKGVMELLQAAKEFPQFRFVIVGECNDTMRNILSEVDNIVIKGTLSHDSVIQELDVSDAFLFPTYSEGFSVALLEAMSRGLPCIATNVGSNLDMIEKQGGIIVPPQNVAEVISAIKSIGDKCIRERMSRWNINKVKNFYLADVVFSQYFEFYQGKKL